MTEPERTFPGGRAHLPRLSDPAPDDSEPRITYVDSAFRRVGGRPSEGRGRGPGDGRRRTFEDYFSTESLFDAPLPDDGEAPDPWTVLGVEPGASWRSIAIAHRTLVKENHPDRFPVTATEMREEAEEAMRLINEAFAALREVYHGEEP